MKRISFILLFVFARFISYSQDPNVKEMRGQAERKSEVKDTTGWQKGGVIGISLAQGSSKNWAAGAEKFSFSTASTVSVFANIREGKMYWNNTLDLGYAIQNTHTVGSRKTDDKIDFFSKLGRDISKTVSIAGVLNFRSQFTDGYDYNYLGKGIRKKTSSFLAPAYVILAPGIDWHPTNYFSIFISPASLRMVIVANDPRSYLFPGAVIPDSLRTPGGPQFETPLAVLYGVDPQRKVRTEVGGFASVNFNKEIVKNIVLKSRLDLYSNYLSTTRFAVTGPDQLAITKIGSNPEKVDIFWTTLIAMKVNRFISVTYNFDLIYDDDVRQFGTNKSSAGTQIRSLLGVGFSAQF